MRGDFDVTAQRGVEGARVLERGLIPKKRRRGHAFLLKQQKNMLNNHKKKE